MQKKEKKSDDCHLESRIIEDELYRRRESETPEPHKD